MWACIIYRLTPIFKARGGFFLEGKKEKRVLSNESTQCDKIIFTISTCLVLYTLKNIKALKNVQIIDIINIGGDLKL